jgi:hypothetical protein
MIIGVYVYVCACVCVCVCVFLLGSVSAHKRVRVFVCASVREHFYVLEVIYESTQEEERPARGACILVPLM